MEEQCTRPAGLSSEKASQHSGLQEGSRGMNVDVAPSDLGPSEGWCRNRGGTSGGLVWLICFSCFAGPLNWACFRLYYCVGPL